MTTLEESGGDDGNSSVSELEVRVVTLEGTVVVHEARLTVNEDGIAGKFKLEIEVDISILLFDSRPRNCDVVGLEVCTYLYQFDSFGIQILKILLKALD